MKMLYLTLNLHMVIITRYLRPIFYFRAVAFLNSMVMLRPR